VLASPESTARDGGRCRLCHDTPIDFQSIVALGVYRDDLRQALLRTKHVDGERLAFALGELLVERVNEPLDSADVIVPVPMNWRRRLVRQINAPELMAAAFGRRLGIRLAGGVLFWRRNVAVQGSLPPRARRRNVSGALGVRAGCDLSGAHILLVDDILTSAATANAATRALRQAGATRVSVAVVARGVGAA
jgi:predicted amidophosphoribosyltransferase